MAYRPLPRVLTTAGAARLGVTESQTRTELRRERWQRLGAGVLLTRPDEPTRDDWVNASTALGGPGAVLSGWDAVRLRGIGANSPPSPLVLVIVRAGRNRVLGGVHLRPSRRPIVSTQLSVCDERMPEVDVALLARAIADTALLHDDLAPVRAMVTSAIQRGLCSPADLATELGTGPRNGSAHLRHALRDIVGKDAGEAHSLAEAEAIELLHHIGVRSFVANAEILDSRGTLLYRVDLLWPHLRAIVEIDSREFHFGEDDWKRTTVRHNKLTALGYAVTHYPPSRSAPASWRGRVRSPIGWTVAQRRCRPDPPRTSNLSSSRVDPGLRPRPFGDQEPISVDSRPNPALDQQNTTVKPVHFVRYR